MFSGCMNRILFVDLSSSRIEEEKPDEKLYRDYLGGFGIGARTLLSRQKPGVDPLGPDNTLGFVTGVLTGTPAISACRYAVVGKSPLTRSWGDANSGGYFGPHLKFSGYDAVFITGVSEKPVYLFIKDGEAELRDAGHLWGKDTYQTEEMLETELGKDSKIACIGQAGEAMSLISCIINEKGRAAARSGLGAVMGSKKLKAIAVTGSIKVPLADENKMKQLRSKYISKLKEIPFVHSLKTVGTIGGTNTLAQIGQSPVKNWSGVGIRDFPNADTIGGENILKYQEKKYACWRCPIGCGGHVKAGKNYPYVAGTHKPEYETAGAFGTLCLNNNLESIIMANEICNRYGLDTMSTGSTVAFAIECYEEGLITRKDTEGIELTWGNHESVVAITEKIAKKEGFGSVLADGVKVAAKRIGKGAVKYAIHIGGQELPMHDPKRSTRLITPYVIDATPARHTQGIKPGFGFEDQKDGLNFSKAYNASGLCEFVNFLGAEAFSEFLNAATGFHYTIDTILEVGERISNIRQSFNVREGHNPLKRQVPGRVIGDPPLQEGPLAGVKVDMESPIQDYLTSMDWDIETGKPSKSKLRQLGLDDIATQLWPDQ
jgi:aldehyde:ferredoxin oxidoreductase